MPRSRTEAAQVPYSRSSLKLSPAYFLLLVTVLCLLISFSCGYIRPHPTLLDMAAGYFWRFDQMRTTVARRDSSALDGLATL